MPECRIRPATIEDLAAINDIYNYYVLHSTSTYQTEPELIESRREWFASHGPVHPVTVAEGDDGVIGWGSLSPFHRRAAFGRTVENSVYVHHLHHRKGIGRMILADLIERASALGHHTIIAGISADQTASLRLHAAAGFSEGGLLREVGFKFGRWLDVIYMELILSEARTRAQSKDLP